MNWCFNRRNLRCESGLTNWLSISKASHMCGDDVAAHHLRIQLLQVSKSFVQKFFVGPRELYMIVRHVIRHIDYAFIANWSQILKFDYARNSDIRFTDIDPKVLAYRPL